jgi:hypothetical protein
MHLFQCLHLQHNEEALLWRAAATTTLLNGTAVPRRLEF